MSATVRTTPAGPNEVYPPPAARRVSWGAILAGAVIGLAVTMLLSLLGIGIGAATIDPATGDTPGAVAGLSGSAIFFGVVQLVSLFVGGFAAARLAGVPLRLGSMLHGAAVWAVATFAIFWLATTAVGTLVGGLATTLSKAGQGVASAAQAAVPDDLSLSDLPDIDMESLPPELRRTLERQGLTVENAREETLAAFRDVVSEGERAEAAEVATDTARDVVSSPGDTDEDLEAMVDRLFGGSGAVLSEEDRQQALTQMQERLGVSEEEAGQMIDQAQAQIEEAQAQVRQATEEAKAQAAEAAESASAAVSAAAFGAFVASLLGLVAAIGGALVGRPRETVEPVRV